MDPITIAHMGKIRQQELIDSVAKKNGESYWTLEHLLSTVAHRTRKLVQSSKPTLDE